MNQQLLKFYSKNYISILLCSLLFILSSFQQAQAQKQQVTFKIMNEKKEPVSFASVSIVEKKDSTRRISTNADVNGLLIVKLANGQYSILVTSVNYQSVSKIISVSNNTFFFNLTLAADTKALGDVTVVAKKPLMKQEDDKTIIDPEALVASSTNGYEVIEKTPGLFVDQDGNIYISSLTPATVYINGREMKMSAADVATMLKNLPPNAISKIEVLRTPSAKYDASGSGGIVNVVLKKGFKIGMTGSINSGIQQGVYGSKFLGLSINNNNGTTSSYLNVNYNRRNSYEDIITNRIFGTDSLLSQDASTKYPANNYFTSYGVAFPLSKKWDLDFDGSVMYQDFDNTTSNTGNIMKISTADTISENMNSVSYTGKFFRVSNGIEFKLKIDSLGSEWTHDLYYSYDRNRIEQQYTTLYYSPVNSSLSGYGYPDNDRNYFTYTTDLKKKWGNKFTLETGAKSSLLQFKSDAAYYKQSGGSDIADNSRTNTFHYTENINAVYLQGSKTFGKNLILKVGTRAENTNMNGQQLIPSDTSFQIHRTDLFPYIYLSKKVMTIAGYELRAYLIYRRSISRPVYDQLNPFPKYLDQYTTEVGNPSLRPQFTTNYEANISVNERPLFAVGINQTKDIFTNVVYQSAVNPSLAYRTYDNLGKNKEWYLRGLGAIPPGGKYFLVVGAQYNHNFYQGLYESQPLSFKKGTWTLFSFQSLKLDKYSQVSLHGFVRFNGQQQFYELSSFGSLNASLNRRFFKEKFIVTLSIADMFATNKNNFTIKQGSVDAYGLRQSDTRRYGINLRYNFGIHKKEDNSNTIFNAAPPVN